jgi:hypothetical protein
MILNIVCDYLFPDTLAKLYFMNQNYYYFTLCEQKLNHNLLSIYKNDHKYMLYIKPFFIIINYNRNFIFVRDTYFNPIAQFYIQNRTLILIKAFDNYIKPKYIINNLLKYFIEFYDQDSLNIQIDNNMLFNNHMKIKKISYFNKITGLTEIL